MATERTVVDFMLADRARQDLAAEHARLTSELEGLTAAGPADRASDAADRGQVALERSAATGRRRRVQDRLSEVAATIRRIEVGTWGTCEGCGGGVGDDRLMARPTATVCVSCVARAA